MESEFPDVLHVVPVADNSILHGVIDLKHGPQLAGLISNMKILHTRQVTDYTDTDLGRRRRTHGDNDLHTVYNIYLDLYVADFGGRANDGSADQRGEDVRREVGASIATLHELRPGRRDT